MSKSMLTKSDSPKYFYLAASVLLIAMYVVFLNPHLDVRGFNAHDPAGYISRALSLWQGVGYGSQYADKPFMPVTAQPPLFAALLAPVVGFFGVNFFVLKLYMLIFPLLLSLSLFRLFGSFLQEKEQAVYSTLLVMASPVIFGLSHRILADVPLFVFVFAGLWSLDRYLRTPVPIFSRWLVLAGVTFSLAYLMKQTALAVFVGGWFLILHPHYRNKTVFQKLIAYSIIASIPAAAWHVWCRTVPDDLWYWSTPAIRDYFWKSPFTGTYGFLSVAEIMVRIRHNLVWGISNNIAMVFFAPFYFLEGSYAGFFLGAPITLWFAWQWGKSVVRQPSVLEGFVLFSLMLLVPKYLGLAARHVAILWPVLIIYVFRDLIVFPKKRILLQSLLVVSMCTTFVISLDQFKNPYGSKTLSDYVAIAGEAKTLLPKDSVCKAPLFDHWQILTGHLCQYEGEDRVTYFVSLSDRAPQNLTSFHDAERDVLQGAFETGLKFKERPAGTEKIFENDTFALFKVTGRG